MDVLAGGAWSSPPSWQSLMARHLWWSWWLLSRASSCPSEELSLLGLHAGKPFALQVQAGLAELSWVLASLPAAWEVLGLTQLRSGCRAV
jgi:hypothetical protein